MFSSARGQVPNLPENTATPSTSYNSYSAVASSSCVIVGDTESDKSGSDVEVIDEVIRTKSKKAKKEKKHKKHKKHKKEKRKRKSSSSSDDVVPIKQVRREVPLHDPEVDNSKFKLNIQKKGLRLATNIPLSIKYRGTTLDHIYPRDFYDANQRYFGSKVTKRSGKPPNERRFRRRVHETIDGFIPLSEHGMGSDEENIDDFDCFDPGMTSEEFAAMQKESRIGFEYLSAEEKRRMVQARIRKDDSNPTLWQRFLKVEEECFQEKVANERNQTLSIRPAYLERRIEVLKQAASKVHGKDKVPFLLQQLECLNELKGTNDKEVSNFWQRLKTLHTNQFSVWNFFIKQNMNTSVVFNKINTLRAFDQAIEKISAILNGTFVSHKPLEGTEDYLISVMESRCRFLIETGHIHQAIAMVQAVVEYECFMPPDAKAKMLTSDRRNMFNKFWMSGSPRVGDDNAKGWLNSLKDEESEDEEVEEKGVLLVENEEMFMSEKECYTTDFACRHSFPVYWSALEETRAKFLWRPARRIFQEDLYEFEARYVPFEEVRSVLLDFNTPFDVEELVFALLAVIGVVDPLAQPRTLKTTLNRLIPDVVPEPLYTFANYQEFLLNILNLLMKVSFIDKDRVSSAIVLTTARFNEETMSLMTDRIKELSRLHTSLPSMSQNSAYIALLTCIDAMSECAGLKSSSAGLQLGSIDDIVSDPEKTAPIRALLTFFNTSLANVQPSVEGQTVLQAALKLCQRFPSSRSKTVSSPLHRLRTLCLLVLDEKTDLLLDIKKQLRPEDVDEAKSRWSRAFQTLKSEPPVIDESKLIMYSVDSFFMLYCMFLFEISGRNPFESEEVNQLVGKNWERILFRVDFASELAKNCLVDFKWYTGLVEKAFDANINCSRIQKHMVELVKTKVGCGLALGISKDMEANKKKVLLLCQLTAVYHRLLSARDQDGTELIAKGYELWLRHWFDQNARAFSDSFVPDSTVWRFWMRIEREMGTAKAEEVYIVGLRHCPYSKLLLTDAAKNPLAPNDLVMNIKQYADQTGINILVLPFEAEAAREKAFSKAK